MEGRTDGEKQRWVKMQGRKERVQQRKKRKEIMDDALLAMDMAVRVQNLQSKVSNKNELYFLHHY